MRVKLCIGAVFQSNWPYNVQSIAIHTKIGIHTINAQWSEPKTGERPDSAKAIVAKARPTSRAFKNSTLSNYSSASLSMTSAAESPRSATRRTPSRVK